MTPDITTLERRLTLLRAEIDWPPTPDLATSVAGRIAAAPAQPARPRPRPSLRLAFAIALAALVAAAGVGAAVSPDVRAAFKRLLGISGAVRIERVDRLPDLGPARDLGLGRRTSLAGAAGRVRFEVRVPRALGAPDAVYFSNEFPRGTVSLVYIARTGLPAALNSIGLLLTEFQGNGLDYFEKLVDADAPVEHVDVNGVRGFWVGGPHVLLLADVTNNPHEVEPRLAAATLVWTTNDGVTHRLETALSKAQALRIARSVR